MEGDDARAGERCRGMQGRGSWGTLLRVSTRDPALDVPKGPRSWHFRGTPLVASLRAGRSRHVPLCRLCRWLHGSGALGAGWAEAVQTRGGLAKLLSVVFPAMKEPEQLELNRILLIGISSNADGAN